MFENVVKSVGLFATRNSNAILTGLGVAGVVTTAVLTGRAAISTGIYMEHESIRHAKYGGELQTKKELVKEVWKDYIPAAAVGAVTIACIIGAHSIGSRKNAALVSAYTLAERSFTDYRKKIADTFGQEKADKAQTEVAEDRVRQAHPGSELMIMGDGEVLCFEVLTGRYFKSSPEKIMRAQNILNGKMLDGSEYGVGMNEFYQLCGIPSTMMGDEMGWNTDARIDISLSSHLTPEDKPCLAISYKMPPFPNYWSANSNRWA